MWPRRPRTPPREEREPARGRAVGGLHLQESEGEAAAGRSAAKLIQDAGLKGTRIGGVEVSRKHSDYFVNCGGGSCVDALSLVDLVVKRVEESSGIRLETEVKIW